MLQQGRIRFNGAEIYHILNALDDIVVKVKDMIPKLKLNI